jgi:predicted permease
VDWPRWIYALRARARAIAGRRRADDDLDDELAFHLAMQEREHRRRGMDDVESSRLARIALGGLTQTQEITREGRPLRSLEILMQDIRFALRLIGRSPGFAVVSVLTIGLGIGANTAIFSIVNGILLEPLPYAEPDRLVRLYLVNPAQDLQDSGLSVPEVDDWRGRTRSFSAIAGYTPLPQILTGNGDPSEIQTAYFVGDLFGALGASALRGRLLTEHDVLNAVPNAVISERLWRTAYGAAADVLGKPIVLSGRTFSIVGVAPARLVFPSVTTDAWVPNSILKDEDIGPRVRDQRVLDVIARLAPGMTLQQAEADVSNVAGQLAAEFPGTNRGWTVARVVPLRTTVVGGVSAVLMIVVVVVGFILLIACANLANLLLARGTVRTHELATRLALGAGRTRIVRQLLTESLTLGLIGGGLGLALAFWGVQVILAMSADTLPRVRDIRVDGRVLGFAVLLTVVTSMLFGILPALRAAHVTPQSGLRAGRGTIGGSRHIRSALVVAEVALAVVLVIGAGLMARNFVRLQQVDTGFDPEQVLAVSLQFNLAGVQGNTAQHLIERRHEMVERIRQLPGVVDAGSVTTLPLEGQCRDVLVFSKRPGAALDGAALRADNCLISPGYLRTMRIPLIRGQMLPERPTRGAPLPFLVSEAAARRFWPGEDPVGQVVRANYGGQAVVVGIVGDVRQHGLAEEPPAVVYFNQITAPRILTTIVLRTQGDPMLLAGPVRELVKRVDPNQPVRSLSTLREVMAESIARDRFFTLLFAIFGSLALALAAIGVYGVFAYSVAQRTQEIGVRMALGAQASHVMAMVVGEGMRLVLAGVAIGGFAAAALSRALQSQLHEVSARDPLTFVLAPVTLMAAALLACYLPARRATRIHTVQALRGE